LTAVKEKLKRLRERRGNAALFGGAVGLVGGLLFFFDPLAALFAGAAGSLTCWYFASLSYWEYRDSVTLNRRNK
jgi:hypothetical protein